MPRSQRNRIVRTDGKQIYLVPKKGHLIVCARGCCCGRTDRGNPPVPIDFYKQEYARRKIRKHVQLTMSGCIGPCPMLNAVQLIFDGRPVWFQSINTKEQILEIFDYLDAMLAADGYLPPPPQLAEYVFDYYRWNHTNEIAGLPLPLTDEDERSDLDGFLFLTHADTDLQSLHHAVGGLPEDFPPVNALSLNKVTSEEQMRALYAAHGRGARVLVARILGTLDNVPGFRWLIETARHHGQELLVLSGTGSPDPELTAASTVSAAAVYEASAYLQAGGHLNVGQCLRFLADHLLLTGFGYDPPRELPDHGVYHPDFPSETTLQDWLGRHDPGRPTVGVLFYRSHWMSGNVAFIDGFVREVERRGMNALPVFTVSLKQGADHATQNEERPEDLPGAREAHGLQPVGLKAAAEPEGRPRRNPRRPRNVDFWPAAFDFLVHPEDGRPLVDVLITSMSFAMSSSFGGERNGSGSSTDVLFALGVPVVQAINGSVSRWQWDVSSRGLNPLDTAMNVALPELDGRLITVPVSFKERLSRGDGAPGFEVVHYAPDEERIGRVTGLADRLAKLRRKPNREKRVAVILTNSNGKAAQIGNAVGLDAPASLMNLFAAMGRAGYHLEDIPDDGDTLIHALIDRCSYDEIFLTEEQLAHTAGRIPVEQYERWFHELPESQQERMTRQWGPPPGEAYVHDGHIALAGLELGNAFLALQPPRGYGMDPDTIYHQPDLPPPHNYYALYRWLRDVWGADAIIHMGKHGTLEWLPGKGVGLSENCFPDTFLGDMPFLYPFIINDPGEGSQAKRRTHAAIVDHLTPPMTTADAYGPLAELTQLVDEYYQVELTDPSKLPLLQQQIWELIKNAHLDEDLQRLMTEDHGHTHEWDEGTTDDGTPLSLASMQGTEIAHVIEELDAYLCELTGAQIRDGLHILGDVPAGEQRVGLLQALTRLPNLETPSLRAGITAAVGLDLDEVLDDLSARLPREPGELARWTGRRLVTHSDALEAIDDLGHRLLERLQEQRFDPDGIESVLREMFGQQATQSADFGPLREVLHAVCRRLVPRLSRTTDEIEHLLQALDGRHVPAGPSGAPTRGMAHILPTGRNFYAADPRSIPSMAAWRIGGQLAREVLERHVAESGDYPETVGISVWGTSNMRTHGDDIAQILALMGVRPKWQQENRRLIGVEVIPPEELGRPRIDVVMRISGFFRDAFPHLIRLLDEAVETVVHLDEPPEQNYLRKHYLDEVEPAVADGECEFEADRRARYRIFGSKPGSYGAGILPLIDERNWQDHADFAEAYVNWGGYAYTADDEGIDARDVFRERLGSVQVALHNQDNREHDIFDSDDYLQFHGGMIATIRALTGRKPRHYFGDTHDPSRPAVRDLKEEALRVFRTRVVNPKWLESIRRHGYKGGLELNATVDYLFGFDATADVVDDWMYEQVAQSYALDPGMQGFFEQSNPWALRAIAERLLEADQRDLWSEADPETIRALQETLLDSETMLESRGETAPPRAV